MRVLAIAPFERGRGQGGSQRATAIAERLEDRGTEVTWRTVPRTATSRASKLHSLVRGDAALAGEYVPPAPISGADADVVIVAHSYLVPAVVPALLGLPRIVDFHNLEFLSLADGRGDAGGFARWPRRYYDRRQVDFMRRLERDVVARADLSLFVSEEERDWARGAVPGARTLLAGSVLPRSEERAAAEIATRRAARRGELVYVGRLTFPTNLISLRRFLARDWPAMRAAEPDLRLTVAGACDGGDRAELERHPGVRALGFVEDLTGILSGCQAVVMPFDGVAGTSLRALFYALAGLPVVGSPGAFRGVGLGGGIVAGDPAAWVDAARETAIGGAGPSAAAAHRTREAQRRAQAHQSDPEPWDRLSAAIAGLVVRARSAVSVVTTGRA
jgi:hypothetical protein